MRHVKLIQCRQLEVLEAEMEDALSAFQDEDYVIAHTAVVVGTDDAGVFYVGHIEYTT